MGGNFAKAQTGRFSAPSSCVAGVRDMRIARRVGMVGRGMSVKSWLGEMVGE